MALDLQASVYLQANASAAVPWDALAQGTTEGDLVERLAAYYGLPAHAAAADVGAFVAALDSNAPARPLNGAGWASPQPCPMAAKILATSTSSS